MPFPLDLRAVTKTFGDGPTQVQALRNANLAVAAGEFVAIMGPSGSGKSTLLTIAGCLEYPTTGQVFISGEEASGLATKERARLRRESIGFVFQEFNLLGGLTATENVAMPLDLTGYSHRNAMTQAEKALERVGLTDRRSYFPDDLSGGERQRVAIARAMVGDRQLLLADEPTGALDSANGEGVMRVLRTACDRGSAVIVVTHDAHLAAWADRVVFIRDGAIISEAVPPGPEVLLDSSAVS